MRTGQGRLFLGMAAAALLMVAASAADAACVAPTVIPTCAAGRGLILEANVPATVPPTYHLKCVRPPIYTTLQCGADCTDLTCRAITAGPPDYTWDSCWKSGSGITYQLWKR